MFFHCFEPIVYTLVGVETTTGGANTYIQAQLHHCALDQGGLQMAHGHGFVRKYSLSSDKWHQHSLQRQDTKCHGTRAPSAFQLLKRKSEEPANTFKFRSVISHARLFLKKLSRLMGRSLPLLLRELHIAHPVWSTPSFLGARDVVRLVAPGLVVGSTMLAERDVDNAYFGTPQTGGARLCHRGG